MVPSLKQSAQGNSLFKNVFPDGLLLIFAEVFLLASLFIKVEQMALITNPITVTRVFIVLNSLLQIALFIFIIPKTSMSLTNDYPASKKKGSNKIKTFFQSVMWLSVFWFIVHFIGVIFGAPLVDEIEETSTWAALITSLIALPAICILGPKPRKWIAVFNCMHWDTTQKRTLFYTSLGVVAVTWCSAVVIPLDWNQPWQKWPIPGIVGGISGYGVGLSYAIAKIIKDAKFSKIH